MVSLSFGEYVTIPRPVIPRGPSHQIKILPKLNSIVSMVIFDVYNLCKPIHCCYLCDYTPEYIPDPNPTIMSIDSNVDIVVAR